MEFTKEYQHIADGIIAMFHQTFTQSEGPDAGVAIKGLVTAMLGTVPPEDMQVFSATDNGKVLASIILTRMMYPEDERTVFILSPVAVSTAEQGRGLGQRLIAHGLAELKANGVDVVLTYGDINFYSKVGFARITETDAGAPLPLQFPEGWLGQSLTSSGFAPLQGPSRCVAPLNDPEHW
jgi:putative acetyltransferase